MKQTYICSLLKPVYFWINFILLTNALLPDHSIAQGVRLNEVNSSNSSFQDSYGKTPDWVELKNTGSTPICLENYSLSDKNDPSSAWKLDNTCLQPGEILLVFLSGESIDKIHADFKLSQHKEGIYLFENGNLIDQFPPVCIPDGYSFGATGTGSTSHFSKPTPGTENDLSSMKTICLQRDSLILKAAPGFYGGDIPIRLESLKGTSISYTLDGTEPDESSKKYTSDLTLRKADIPPDQYALISTGEDWSKPSADIFNGFALRAVAYDQGCPVSNEINASYFIHHAGRNRYDLPVVSIIADPDDLFSDNDGIYVPGDGEEFNYNLRGKKSERDIHLEYFNADGLQFSQEAAMRIHGRYTRNKPQKSLRIYSAEDSAFNLSFFGESEPARFKTFTLGSVDKHKSYGLFKDELINYVAADMHIGTLASRPSILFINGEYWGIHNLKERQDKYYIQSHYNANIETLDFLSYELEGDDVIEGSFDEYNNFVSTLQTLNMNSQDAMSFVEKNIDLQNFINYVIAHIYFANYDWPHNNVRFWKEKNNGKWRWMFFDCDLCMLQKDYDAVFKNLIGDNQDGPLPIVFSRLLESKEFRDRFFQQFLFHLTNTFHPSSVLNAIDLFERAYAPYVFEHIERWGTPTSYEAWQGNVARMKTFAVERPTIMLDKLIEYFGNPVRLFPNPAAEEVNISFMNTEQFSVRIFDSKGCVLRSFSTGDAPVYIGTLASGLYFIEVTYGELRFTNKLIKN